MQKELKVLNEMLDIFSRNGEYLGVESRDFCHSGKANVYHKAVLIWFKNSKGEILVTKRAMNKKQYPGKWEMSAAGHVDAGESPLDTCVREIKEELGIDIEKEKIEYLTEWIIDEELELAQVYLVRKDIPINNMCIEREELDDIKWLSYNEFVKLLYSDEFCDYENKEHKMASKSELCSQSESTLATGDFANHNFRTSKDNISTMNLERHKLLRRK